MSVTANVMIQDARLEQLTQWVQHLPGWEKAVLRPASADASFRRYFRLQCADGQTSRIIMDAPPDKGECKPFVQVAE